MFDWLRGKSRTRADEVYPDGDAGRFLEGAYRLHQQEDVQKYTSLASAAFPNMAKRINCFASSWLGCQFATDEERIVGGERQIALLEPGTGQALMIPAGLSTFHTDLLLKQPDAVAAYSFFKDWMKISGHSPSYGQCIGYRKPLYLGGADEVSNLEVADFDVYWTITAQLLERVRGLPEESRIESVKIGN